MAKKFPDLNKDGKITQADILKGRGVFQEGGDVNSQMAILMKPQKEQTMVSDEEMEEDYLDFILDEALSEEEEDMLQEKLEQDEQLAMLFDKVVDVAQEFAGSGPVEGPGSGVSDSIPARLSDGEFVFTAKATEEIGADELMRMMKDAEAQADERQQAQDGGMMGDQKDFEEFLQDIHNTLPNVYYMDVSGGEPTLNKTFISILDRCIEINHARNMHLEITTNAQQINPKLLERLHHFRHVNIFVSVDGYKDVYEYIRWKGSWNKLEKNIIWLKENANNNISIICHQTSQVLNILNLPDLLDWYQQNNINWTNINAVTRPNHHNILVLPKHIRNIAQQKWQSFLEKYQPSLHPQQEMNTINIIKSLETTDQNYERKWWKYFVRDTMIKDEIRKQSLEKSVPELYNLIKEDYRLENET